MYKYYVPTHVFIIMHKIYFGTNEFLSCPKTPMVKFKLTLKIILYISIPMN